MSDQSERKKMVQLYQKIDELLTKHELVEVGALALEILAENNLYIDPDIVGIQVDRLKDYQKFIQIQLFHKNGIKAVLRISEGGLVVRYIEGISECNCGEA